MTSKKQDDHIKAFGMDRYMRLLAAASLVARTDSRFIGATKIRQEITARAALEASGYERKPFVLSKSCGEITRETEDAAQEVFAKAFEAACKAAQTVTEPANY